MRRLATLDSLSRLFIAHTISPSWTHYRARRLGLPAPNLNPFHRRDNNSSYRAPAPAADGIQGWLTDKWHALRNQRTAGGAYEGTGHRVGGRRRSTNDRRGFGALDPDEAWDTRVDNEASGYYEEQELGLQDPSRGPYGGDGYGDVGIGGIEEGRGRSQERQRELDHRYDEEMHGGAAAAGQRQLNPFGDGAEPSSMSLRGVSPRPHLDMGLARGAGGAQQQRNNGSLNGDADTSPTERKSMFREDV